MRTLDPSFIRYDDFSFIAECRKAIQFFNGEVAHSVSYHKGNAMGGFAFVEQQKGQFMILAYGHGKWIDRGLIPYFFRYPFEKLRAWELNMKVKDENIRSLRLTQRFGAKIDTHSGGSTILRITRKDYEDFIAHL